MATTERVRLLTDRETAMLLGRSPGWLSKRRVELERAGFPRRLPVLNAYNKAAVEKWIATSGGVEAESTPEHDPYLEAINGGGTNALRHRAPK